MPTFPLVGVSIITTIGAVVCYIFGKLICIEWSKINNKKFLALFEKIVIPSIVIELTVFYNNTLFFQDGFFTFVSIILFIYLMDLQKLDREIVVENMYPLNRNNTKYLIKNYPPRVLSDIVPAIVVFVLISLYPLVPL
jgi:hypothetical protein